jgi:hypothetical protein
MKVVPLCLAALQVCAGLLLKTDDGAHARMSPNVRMVQLLKKVKEDLDKNMKIEKKMWEKFYCWHQNLKVDKKAAKEEALKLIAKKQQYIQDINDGKINFTTEEADLTKEVADLKAKVKEIEDARAQWVTKYKADKKTHEQMIAALKKAWGFFDKTGQFKDVKFGEFLEMPGGAVQPRSAGEALERVLMQESHGGGNPDFMQLRFIMQESQVLSSQTPNKKGEFMNDYKTSSGPIIAVLSKMKKDTDGSLKDLEKQEKENKEAYDKELKLQSDLLGKAEVALGKLEKEAGARKGTKEETQKEIDDIKKLIKSDDEMLQREKKTFDEMNKFNDERTKVQLGEIAAVQKVIDKFSGDEARDTFRRSFHSVMNKGESYHKSEDHLAPEFLQVSALAPGAMLTQLQGLVPQTSARMLGLMAEVRLAFNHPSVALTQLQTSQQWKFDVKKATDTITKVLEDMKKEGEKDAADKEACEKDLNDLSVKIRDQAQVIDTNGLNIMQDLEIIREKLQEIADAQKRIEDHQEQLKEMTRQRNAENAAFKLEEADDKAAIQLLQDGKKILKDFFDTNFKSVKASGDQKPSGQQSSGFIQLSTESHADGDDEGDENENKLREDKVGLGELKAPPPKTPNEEFGRYKGSSSMKNILSMLDILVAGLKKDMAATKKVEDDAQKNFDESKKKLDDAVKALTTLINGDGAADKGLKGVVATKRQAVVDARKDIDAKRTSMDGDKKSFLSTQDSCAFLMTNFDERVARRQKETDGLLKAMTFLKSFKPAK